MSPSTFAAGWYPDPWVPGQLRYWDGEVWTDHVETPQGAVTAAPVPTGSVPTEWLSPYFQPPQQDMAQETEQFVPAPESARDARELARLRRQRSVNRTPMTIALLMVLAGVITAVIMVFNATLTQMSSPTTVSTPTTKESLTESAARMAAATPSTITASDVRAITAAYWLSYKNDSDYQNWAAMIASGKQNYLAWLESLEQTAVQRYPVAAQALGNGQTMTQVMKPWVEAYAAIMGEPASSVDVLNSYPLMGVAQSPTWPSFTQFQTWVEQDPAYKNAGPRVEPGQACAAILQAGYLTSCA
jgi:hypothetical protein